MNTPSHSERRRFVRYPVTCQVQYAWSDFRSEARVTELGLGGLFLDQEILAEPDDIVRLRIDLEPNSCLDVAARVLYIRPGDGTGCEFLPMNPEQLKRLTRFLTELDPLAGYPTPTADPMPT
jgi:hypothetical protein